MKSLFIEKIMLECFLRGPSRKKGMSVWDMNITLSKNWKEITRIATNEERPFAYQFYLKNRMKKMA